MAQAQDVLQLVNSHLTPALTALESYRIL